MMKGKPRKRKRRKIAKKLLLDLKSREKILTENEELLKPIEVITKEKGKNPSRVKPSLPPLHKGGENPKGEGKE